MAFRRQVVHSTSAMGRLGSIILLSAAAIGVLALPAAAFLFIQSNPDTWLNELQHYQSLAGGLATLFAAGLATVGVWINVSAQRHNVSQQIAAQQGAITQQIQANADRARDDWLQQRKEAAYLRHLDMQHLAAGFIGEIEIMLRTLRGAAAHADLASEGEKLSLIAVFGGAHIILFEKNADRIGMFPAHVVGELTTVYGLFVVFGELFRSPSVEKLSPREVSGLLSRQKDVIEANIRRAEAVLIELKRIQADPFDDTPYKG